MKPMIANQPHPGADPGLRLALRLQSGGPVLASEPVTDLDLTDALTETLRECCLRKGRTGVSLRDLSAHLVPLESTASPSRFTGYALEVTDPSGTVSRCEFTIYSLEAVARRAAAALLESGALHAGDEYVYEIEIDPDGQAVAPALSACPAFEVDIKTPPLQYLEVPLRSLMERARPANAVNKEDAPLFYTETALADAELFSRKGAVINPRFESGGVLVGPLCSCPETGEFFAIVTHVFEVTDAEQGIVSLEYTSKSWARIQTVIRAQQSAQPAVRMLGQCHGHNFLPNNGVTCAACLKLPVCTLTNLGPSEADKDWMSAVFAKQPWMLCHIYGLSARGDKIDGLYGLRDARLLERGFHVLPHFDPEEHPTRTAPQQDKP